MLSVVLFEVFQWLMGPTEEVSDSGKDICLGRLHSDFTWVHLLTVTVIFSGLYNFQKLSAFFDITDTIAPPLTE